MLGTADSAPRETAPATEVATRPMRLLVPTERRDDFFLSYEDTLRASDLGITRHTTDAELDQLRSEAEYVLGLAGLTEEPSFWLCRIRDALRHPRDIAEARAWGFTVPHGENKEEFSEDPRRRLGWWWVYDPERVETRAQRQARYEADHRLIDMKGYARCTLRAYITTKDRKVRSDAIRRILEDPAYRAEKVAVYVEHNPDLTAEKADEMLLAEARQDILKAMPRRRDRGGQSDRWYVADALKDGNDNERLNEWYEFNAIRQTGRPLGAKTRNRRMKKTE